MQEGRSDQYDSGKKKFNCTFGGYLLNRSILNQCKQTSDLTINIEHDKHGGCLID